MEMLVAPGEGAVKAVHRAIHGFKCISNKDWNKQAFNPQKTINTRE